MTTTHRIGPVGVAGDPIDIALGVVQKVAQPVALVMARELGADAVMSFYTALVTGLLCDVATLFDEATARDVSEATLLALSGREATRRAIANAKGRAAGGQEQR